MAKKQTIDPKLVKSNIQKLQELMQNENLEAFYVSSFDEYINEYVPMSNCHRFYFTGFSGSVAEVLALKSGEIRLYVDGRYHEQADSEVDQKLIKLVKVPSGQTLAGALFEDFQKLAPKTIGIEGLRTSLATYEKLSKVSEVKTFSSEIESMLDKPEQDELKPIKHIPKKYRGRDTNEKLAEIFKDSDDEAYFVTAIDSLAWITNCRGYHLPHMSSFLGSALVTANKVFVFIDENTALEDSTKNINSVEFIFVKKGELKVAFESNFKDLKPKKIYVDQNMTNVTIYQGLKSFFGEDKLVNKPGGLVFYHSIKDEGELKEMKRGFDLGDTAIYNTIRWVKDQLAKGEEISEYGLYEQTTIEYRKQGALEQSFNTIAGVGANGSIMHYGDPKAEIKIKKDDMILLDSGGYFEGGFATDTTRTFMASDAEPSAKHKEIYTLVLKGMLQCQSAIFPEGTQGITLDSFARKPIFQAGYNFAHGTGHGVGVHVHEGGVRISNSQLPMKVGQVVSIEPGIYLPGFGGVRLENIATVVPCKKHEGFLEFEPLVYIGFESSLIDQSLLNEDEKSWLEQYEAECTKRGRSFRQ